MIGRKRIMCLLRFLHIVPKKKETPRTVALLAALQSQVLHVLQKAGYLTSSKRGDIYVDVSPGYDGVGILHHRSLCPRSLV